MIDEEFVGCTILPPQEKLLQIVNAQVEILKLGIDLPKAMMLVAKKTEVLTGAEGVV